MLDLKDIFIKYNKEIVFNSFNLNINGEKIYLLLGENGSGKSTILKIIAGIIKPNSGRIESSYKRIAFLPEKAYIPKMIYFSDYLVCFSNIKKADAINIGIRFNLNGKRVFEFSKGMRQKAALIGTLYLDRDLYLLDEPYDGIDIDSKDKINSLLNELVANKKTIIITTHDENHFKNLVFERIQL
jgi:ABC-type multidrug transport system ATPase subunit